VHVSVSRYHQSLAPARQVAGRLDDHAFAASGGEFGPPAGPGVNGSRDGRVHGDAAGRRDKLGVGGDQPVGEVQVPGVRPLVVGRRLGGQQLEGTTRIPARPSVGQQ